MMGYVISMVCLCASLLIVNVVNMQQSDKIKDLQQRVQVLEQGK